MHTVLKTVATFEYAHFAHIAKTKLESEEIECFLFDENTSSMIWFYNNAIGGIKLKVRAEDLKRARKILEENNETFNDDNEFAQDEISSFDSEEAIRCPKCNSDKVEDEKFSKKFAYLSIIFFGFPFLFKTKKFECKNCGNKWNKNKRY
jgi:cell division protein FtsB